jgi:hypothetical protein
VITASLGRTFFRRFPNCVAQPPAIPLVSKASGGCPFGCGNNRAWTKITIKTLVNLIFHRYNRFQMSCTLYGPVGVDAGRRSLKCEPLANSGKWGETREPSLTGGQQAALVLLEEVLSHRGSNVALGVRAVGQSPPQITQQVCNPNGNNDTTPVSVGQFKVCGEPVL